MSAPVSAEFHTRRSRLVITGAQAVGSLGMAGACLPLAVLGAPLMASVGALLASALAFSLGRAAWREAFGEVGPRLVLDAGGVALRNLGGRVAQRLPWSWVERLQVDPEGRHLVIELAGGRRVRDGKPLALPLDELPSEALETCRRADAWIRSGRREDELAAVLGQSR